MSDPYYGEVKMIGFYYAPLHYAFCSGQTMPMEQNMALYSLIGTLYGGDGKVSFNLPDLRGRVPIHSSNGEPGPGLYAYELAQQGGVESSNLIKDQIPLHSHNAIPKAAAIAVHSYSESGDSNTPEGNFWACGESKSSITNGYNSTSDTQMDANAVTIESLNIEVGDTGGTKPYSRLQPYLAVNFVIALAGTYPPRN